MILLVSITCIQLHFLEQEGYNDMLKITQIP